MYFASCNVKTIQPDQFARHILPDYYFLGCSFVPFFYEDKDGIIRYGTAEQIRIVPPGNPIFHGAKEKGQPFSDAFIYIGGDDVQDLFKRYPLPQFRPFSIQKPYILRDYIPRLLDERYLQLPGSGEKIHSLLTEMVIDLYRSYLRLNEKHSKIEKLEEAHYQMSKDFSRNWTLDDLAQIANYSPTRFSVVYHERYGLSPFEYLNKLRIQAAKDMLKNSNDSVSSIALRVGYSNIYYFCRRFKKEVGNTPTEYAKKYHTP